MTWEAIGVIVDIFGVLAVLVTLIYLSIQTRLTRIAVEEASEHSAQQATDAAQQMYSVWRRSVFDSPDLVKVLVKARGVEPLTAEEQVLFSTYFDELIFTAVTSHRSFIHKTIGYTDPIDVTHLVAHIAANPRSVEEWRRVVNIVEGISPEFVAAVEKLLSKTKPSDA